MDFLPAHLDVVGIAFHDDLEIALVEFRRECRQFAQHWIDVQKAEFDFMFSPDVAATTSARPDQYIKLKDSKKIIIDGDYDVFGDATVTLILTPGHTPGHQCLLVRLPKTGPVLLTGDLYHFPGEREFHTFPQVSNAQYVASRAKVEALIEKTGAQLWIQHDMIGNRKLKKSPEFYE